ncbi:MAG: hypothetical protein GY765_06365 [bacterium]|nr:hypothetical protein [bacterium]
MRLQHVKILCTILCLCFWALQVQAVVVSNVSQLTAAISAAAGNGDKEIILTDGTYQLSSALGIWGNDLIIRSQSGNRDAVIIRGTGMSGGVTHVFNVAGTNFTARDMTIGWVANHAVQIWGNNNSSNTLLRNLRIVDTMEQMVKISYNSSNSNHSENGVVENCLMEYTAGVGPQWYIGGIDGHRCVNWTVRNNIFKNISSPSAAVAEHGVHFWSDSQGTLVENNLFIDCDRGIGFGLGSRGHIGGTIRNNIIYHSATNHGFADVGIGLESASNVSVYNNTIFMLHSYQNAIEYRFTDTAGGIIRNNLCNKRILSRNGGTATLSNNITTASASWFENPSAGDFHLTSAVSSVVDKGVAVSGLVKDYYGNARPSGGGYDIGAHEYSVTDYYIFHGHDFNGDNSDDIAIYRPANGRWCIRGSASIAWGTATDIPVPGDYNGDGTTDIAIYRPANGRWCIRGSASIAWGTAADIPVPGDYDGDGTTDIAIYRPANGRWCIRGSASVAWGAAGDIPVPGDYDGDGTTDIAIYRPSTGGWSVKGSTTVLYGAAGDIPIPADYNGDGSMDIAIFRPSNGRWCVRGNASIPWGTSSDIPVPGDYNGDGTDEIAIYRQSNGTWAVRGTTSIRYGTATDVPLVSHWK